MSPHLPRHYTVLRAYKSPKGSSDGKDGWWTSRFRGPSLARKGVLGGTPYTSWFMVPRLVRRPVHVLWPMFFFLNYAALYCTTSGPGGKVTSSFFGFLPLQVPSEGWTTGWFMPAFNPFCIPSSLRPLLSSPVIRVIWCFFCRLYANFSCFLACFPAWYSANSCLIRGDADLVEAVDSLEEVSWGKLFSLLPGLAPVGCFVWPPFHIYTPQFVWTE